MRRRSHSRRLSSLWDDLRKKAKETGVAIQAGAGKVKALTAEFEQAERWASGLRDDLKSRGKPACRKAFSEVLNSRTVAVKAEAAMNIVSKTVPELRQAKSKAFDAITSAEDAFESVCITKDNLSGMHRRRSR